LFVNQFDDFYSLLDGVTKGDNDCFRAGVIIGENGRQFGANTYDVIEAFSKLADRDPGKFSENNKAFNMSDDFLVKVLSIPDWKFSRVKINNIKETIAKRKKYINQIISDKEVLDKVLKEYQVAEKRLKDISRKNLEYFHESGARLIYSSRYPSLISDKEYPLKNISDNDSNTAWCILGNQDKHDWGNIWVEFDLNKLNSNSFECRGSGNLSEKNECYVEELVMRIRPGYQKSKQVFEKNSRPQKITATLRFDNVKNKHFKDVITLSDIGNELKEQKIIFPIEQWLSTRFSPIKLKINFDSVKMGSAYPELCISGLTFDLK
jgi:hypothetical protein